MIKNFIVLAAMSGVPGSNMDYLYDVRQVSSAFPPTLQDIASKLPEGTQAKDSDLITYAHEGTHFLARGTSDRHGLYLNRGLRIYLPIPNIPTAELFRAIPLEDRGTIYETYRRQGMHSYWKSRPTMVIDEWVAYTNGSIVRTELGIKQRKETDVHSATMGKYTWHLIRLSKQVDGFPYKELVSFARWNEDRCRRSISDWSTLFDKTFE